jgi:hypothetical protein
MAETKYSIHEGSPKIYVHIPDGKSVTVDDSTKGTVKVTIPKDTYMKATKGFGYNYCAFVQIEVTKSNGDKFFIPELDIDDDEGHTKKMITHSGKNEFDYFKSSKLADYVFLFRVGTPSNNEADWVWTDFPTLTANRTKTFEIGSDVKSYTVYFCGITLNTATWTNDFKSDSIRKSTTYTWVTDERNTDTDVWDNGKRIPGGGGNACPCDVYKDTIDSETLLTKNLIVKPISKPADIISVTDNGDNTVTFTMPPFRNGTNNKVACQEGFINFQRSCVYTGEYFDMGTSDFKHNDKATKLIKNAAGQYEKDLNILSESEIAADGRYYKNSDGTYTYCTDSKNANATYRAVGYDRLLKRQYFPKTNNAAGSFYERIGDSWNPGNSITLTLPIPFAALNINNKNRLYGTTYVWVDTGAIATDRTYLNELVDGIYIECANADNVNYFTNKSYSRDYFETGWKYYKESGSGEYKAVGLSHTGKGTYYYISNKGQYGYDLRYCQYCEVTFNSYPRAPRNLWYESTHKNKTYTSNEKVSQIDTSKIYKENLRPRLKDTLTWCWDSGFGGLRSAKIPNGYEISIYRKSPDGTIRHVLNNLNSNNMIEVYANEYSIQPKELGFESGDLCGCKVIAFDKYEAKKITPETDGMIIYKTGKVASDEVITNPKSLYGVTSNQYSYNYYKSTTANATLKQEAGQEAGLYNMKLSGFSGDVSFADGGRPALVGPNDEKIGYDYNASEACEVRNGAIVWVKVSDTNNSEDDWVEGTPWVKTENGWKEADSLYVKTNNNSTTGWKESD